MHITYKPEENPGDGWVGEFLATRIPMSDCEAIEKASGMNYGTFVDALQEGAATPRRVLFWYMSRRTHPRLRLDEIPDFGWDEFEVEYSVRELRKLRAGAEKSRTLSEVERAERLAAIDEQIEEMTEKFGDDSVVGDEAGLGKAHSNGSGSTTPSILQPSST